MIRCLLAAVLVVLGLSFSAVAGLAQSAPEPGNKSVVIDKRKLLVQPRNSDGSLIVTPFFEDPVGWMRDTQQNFYGRMAGSMRGLLSASASKAGWTLFVLSFLYGVFHAAGPGHGKAVITGWLLATESDLRRGIVIAFLSALFQALTAIVVVSALLLFVASASAMARDVAGFLESTSYAMIAGMGLYLAWTGGSTWFRRSAVVSSTGQVAVSVPSAGEPFVLVSRPGGVTAQAFGPDHVHDENCGCGHAHMPTAVDVRGAWSWRRAIALAFAVGIRPCSGALAVLVFSYSLGLYWAGVASVLAMGFGVFLTIAAIASMAVFAKSTAMKFGGTDSKLARLVVAWGKVVIGLAIAGLGVLLLLGSLGRSNMMM